MPALLQMEENYVMCTCDRNCVNKKLSYRINSARRR